MLDLNPSPFVKAPKGAKSPKPRQLSLGLKRLGRGGPRKGAGRPPKNGMKAGVSHLRRPEFPGRHPLQVTLKVLHDVRDLREPVTFGAIRGVFAAACTRPSGRVVHWSVQGNHLHMLVESEGAGTLSRGMTGLNARLAKAINRAQGRRGRVFADRYHAEVKRTPSEVAQAIRYVLKNVHLHGRRSGRPIPERWVDPCSSEARDAPRAEPGTWLLRVGWQRGRVPAAMDVFED